MIIRISYKNLLHKPLYAVLCWLLLACSTAVLLVLISLNRQSREQLEKQIDGIDMVLGAKGSPLQLILSSVYNLDAPTGNISLAEASRFMHHPLVESAIPLSLGDSYHGYRIIGTTPAYLEKYQVKPASGKVFSRSMEVVVGATVAKRAGLSIGKTFAGTHGLGEKGHVHEEHLYVVTGILPPTGLSLDQLILTPLSSVWTIHETAKSHRDEHDHAEGDEHDHEKAEAGAITSHHKDHEDETHDHETSGAAEPAGAQAQDKTAEQAGQPANSGAGAGMPFMAMASAPAKPEQQITAVLIKFRSPLAQLQLPRMINENTNMQAAVPAIEVNRLQSLLGAGTEILRILGWLLAGLAACSIFVMLVQGTHERRYELALMRSMGGSRLKLLGLVLTEAAMLALAGILGGFLLSRAALFLLQQEVFTHYHLNFSNAWKITAADFYTAGAIFAACLLAALFPAIRAFRLNISKTLANA
ncbi:ABC transporter permease [Chitinophaga barathri]|uniref:ABC transporter permease n=1 Tax=Chitinophaga barathri TaxID=1647451 RepID=A0A3N4MA68_9BACT|nr:ABC transporter permease [Chitinophaga barathri]RPD40348.1 ABC transporter permease [Chitinophaga barathri]